MKFVYQFIFVICLVLSTFKAAFVTVPSENVIGNEAFSKFWLFEIV